MLRFAGVENLEIVAGGGNDALALDLAALGAGGLRDVLFDGGAGADRLTIEGTDGDDAIDITVAGGLAQARIAEIDGVAFAPGVEPTVRTAAVEDWVLNLGGGNDSVTGVGDLAAAGISATTITVAGGDGSDSIDFGGNGIAGDPAGPVNVSLLLYGGAGGDSLTGGALDDRLYGEDDGDRLVGGGGDDELRGGTTGGDELYGDVVGDLAGGTGGSDSLFGALLDGSTLYGDAGGDVTGTAVGGADFLYGGDAGDAIYGDAGDNLEDGGIGGADTVYGDGGGDTIYGDAGSDLRGGPSGEIARGGADLLYGGRDDDAIYGDAGDDIRDGAISGADTLYGESGADELEQQRRGARIGGLAEVRVAIGFGTAQRHEQIARGHLAGVVRDAVDHRVLGGIARRGQRGRQRGQEFRQAHQDSPRRAIGIRRGRSNRRWCGGRINARLRRNAR